MSLFAGIDYDSEAVYTALVDEDTGELVEHRSVDLACGPGDSFDRARRVRDLLPDRGRWEDAGVLAIGIEATYSQAFKATIALGRVQGAVLACLPPRILILPIAANRKAPAGWKALTVGRTNASKDDVADWARANGAPGGLEQDFYDAFCIARATGRIWETRREPAALTKGKA